MHNRRWIYLLLVSGVLWLAGCGGGSGVFLSGGSVPIGGRAVTGVAVLPTGAPVANAQVTIKLLPAGSVLRTTTTDANGRFTAPGIPTNSDISVVVSQPPTRMLEAIVPRANLAGSSSQPLDIGSVTALTTLVAEAIHLEHGPAPEDAPSIVMNQQGHLMQQADNGKYSIDMENHFIDDPSSLMMGALGLLSPVANTELTAFTAGPSTATAGDALNGLLGYVRAPNQRDLHLNETTRAALIKAQLAGTIYSPDTVALALSSITGTPITAADVSSASQKERAQLPALASLGNGITAFEALVIAADGKNHGGFQLNAQGLDKFLTILVKQSG